MRGSRIYSADACWGGHVRIIREGLIQSEQQLPQDVTALVWIDERLVVAGLADGQVVALEAK